MAVQRRDSDAPFRKLEELLLAYLLAAGYPPWPGADGVTVEDVLGTYTQASAQGLVPGPDELRNRYPELAEQEFPAPVLTGQSEEQAHG